MYSKIKCSKEHKRCFIPEHVKEKLKNAKSTAVRVATIGGVFLVLASFASCSGAKDIKNEIETTTPQITTTIEDTTKKHEISTTEAIVTTIATTKPQETTIRETTKPPPTTTVTTTQQATTKPQTTTKQTKVVTINPTQKNYNKERLNKILVKVNNVLDKKDPKNFPELSKKYIREGVERIFNNYAEWSIAYKDLPTIEEYVDGTIIPGIKNARKVTLIDYDSQKAQQMIDDGDALAATRGDECDVYLLYKNPKQYSEDDHIEDLEMLFHEFKHCKDKKVLYNTEHFENDEGYENFYTEGGATFHQKFMKPISAQHFYFEEISNEEGDKCVQYGKGDGVGYILYSYIYENLVYLAGYNTVEAVGQGAELDSIRVAMEKKYGEDMANELWADFGDLYFYFENCYNDNDAFKHSIKAQNDILECIKQDIKKLNINNKDEIRRYMEIYRNYKFQIMPEVKKDITKDLTTKAFNTDITDDMLIEKIEKSGAIEKFSSNPKLNKMALKAMLLSNNQSYYRLDGIYDTLYLPNNIASTQYNYFEKDGKGFLEMNYTDKDGTYESVGVNFDEEKIIKVAESEGIDNIKSNYIEHDEER